jgi:hypothetical protein
MEMGQGVGEQHIVSMQSWGIPTHQHLDMLQKVSELHHFGFLWRFHYMEMVY